MVKRILSFILSFSMLFSVAFAGGENKIVYTDDGGRHIYVSTENIPRLIELLQSRWDKEKSRTFSHVGNGIYKALVACAGVGLGVLLYNASQEIDDETVSTVCSISSCVATAVGTIATMLIPEYMKKRFDKFKSSIQADTTTASYEYANKRYQELGYNFEHINKSLAPIKYRKFYFEGLIMALEAVCPLKKYRDKHNKEVKGPYDMFSSFDPWFTDLDEGIVISDINASYRMEKLKAKGCNYVAPEYEIYRQGQPIYGKFKDNCIKDNCLVVLDSVENSDYHELSHVSKTVPIQEFNDKLVDIILCK